MTDNKEIKQQQKQIQEQKAEVKEPLQPDRVKAKIEIPDNRERRDGPGGN